MAIDNNVLTSGESIERVVKVQIESLTDAAKTQRWLAAEGHRQEGVFVGTRLARVFAEGRSELLLFYGETTALTGVDCDDEAAAMQHVPTIIARSEAALKLVE